MIDFIEATKEEHFELIKGWYDTQGLYIESDYLFNGHSIICTYDNEPIVYLQICVDMGSSYACIGHCKSNPNAPHVRTGKCVIQSHLFALDYLQSLGIKFINAQSNNKSIHKMYEKMGLSEVPDKIYTMRLT